MSGRYRKIDQRIWNDEKFRALSDEAKLVFFMLLTHPSMTMLGAMRATLGGLAEELSWKPEAFRKAFGEVLAGGMADHDADAHLIALPNFLRYNKPESPNVVKSWSSALDLLPECNLKTRVVARSRGFAEAMSEGFAEALPDAFRQAMPNQEQEQEQEQEQDKTYVGGKAAPYPPCPHNALVELYHEALPELPRAKLMGEPRKKALGAFWRWVFTEKRSDGTARATSADEALTWIRQYFERARGNDFLMGRMARAGEHANWKCDLEFLLGEKGKRHVIEKTGEVAA